MYFEAELIGKEYEIDVNEDRHNWKIAIKEKGTEWVFYTIPKTDYNVSPEAFVSFLFKGSSYLIDVIGKDTDYEVYTRGSFRDIKIFNEEMLLHQSLKAGSGFAGEDSLRAGMPGKIIEIFVKPGETVAANRPLLIMEAMKMENEMRSSREVTIKEICVNQGDSVDSGSILIKFE